MSDRTWNPIDAKLYEENWSQCAKLVAGVMLARCPNQYGIFDIPEWFLRTMFEGLYAWAEIEGGMVEWEAAGFVKFYDDRRTIWVVKKWKREQKNPSDLNYKGMFKFLQGHNKDLIRDFIALYVKDQAPYKGLIRGLQGDTKGIPSTDTDTDTDTDSEADAKKTLPDKSGDDKPKRKKRKAPAQSDNKTRQITDCYQDLYVHRFKDKPIWGPVTGKRVRSLLKDFDGNADRICKAIKNAFDSEDMFLSNACGSFMTLTAHAVITKADSAGDGYTLI